MQAVFLPSILFMCLCSLGKCQMQRDACVPFTIENGFIVQREDSVMFLCNHGFKLHTGCSKGSWSLTPKCIAGVGLNECTAPPTIENGMIVSKVQNKYPDGSKVKYSCDELYKLDGKDTITCSLGNWTDPPLCIKSSCGKPDGEHMELNPDLAEYDDGSSVRYICKSPYTAKPGQELSCMDGQWNGKVECMVSQGSCVPPLVESFIQAIDTQEQVYPSGTQVTFQCPAFYSFQESHEEKTIQNVCHNGQWVFPMRCYKPCVVTQKDMDDRNIQFRYPIRNLKYLRHNDHISFVCKMWRKQKSDSFDMRPVCVDGNIILPECH
ncbi:complement factor H-like isoform X1 [Alosa pseudoharengus]|uniref:complement factor H-like isoform X1 n=1 Tax=Alosa pseudoharengus TaxID=34774 RepID=UPI003F8B0DE1